MLQRRSVCCSVLQCAVFCSMCCIVLQCVAVSLHLMKATSRRYHQCVAVCVLHSLAVYCRILRCLAVSLRCLAVSCSVFAASCSVLQCIAVCLSLSLASVCCNILQCVVIRIKPNKKEAFGQKALTVIILLYICICTHMQQIYICIYIRVFI